MKKIWFLLLTVLVFGLSGCGGGGGDDDGGGTGAIVEPLTGSVPTVLNGEISITATDGVFILPSGGPYVVNVIGIDNLVSAPVDCTVSFLTVSGTGNKLWFHGTVENLNISGIETVVHLRKDATPATLEISGINTHVLKDL